MSSVTVEELCENNPDNTMGIPLDLSQLGLEDYTFLTENLRYKIRSWTLEDVGIYQAGRV